MGRPLADLTRYSLTYARLVFSAWMKAIRADGRSSSRIRSVHFIPRRPNDSWESPVMASTLLSKRSMEPSRYPLNVTAGMFATTILKSCSVFRRLCSRSLRSVMSKNRPLTCLIWVRFENAVRPLRLSGLQLFFRIARHALDLPVEEIDGSVGVASKESGRNVVENVLEVPVH